MSEKTKTPPKEDPKEETPAVETVKVKALSEIHYGGKIHKAGTILEMTAEEAKLFCKPIKGAYNGWGEGAWDRYEYKRAERVA